MKLMWKDVWPVWWSFVWRSFIYGSLGGFVFGALGGALAGVTGHLEKARQMGAIFGYIAGLSLSTFAMKQTLEKHITHLAKKLRTDDF
jgi:outer membrane lipoprotein SlyB